MPDSQIPSDWLKLFWEWAKKHQLSTFQNKLIVPAQTSSSSSQFTVVKLSLSQPVIFISSYLECSKTTISVMEKYKVPYSNQAKFPYLAHRSLSSFVKTYSPAVLLEVIGRTASYRSVSLTTQQAECLRNTISKISQLSIKDHKVVKGL